MMRIITMHKRSVDIVRTCAATVSSNMERAASFVILIAVSWLSIAFLTPPPAKSIDADAVEFSAARAMAHVKMIAGRSHPVGTIAHGETRRYIIDQLNQFGTQPEIQETTLTSEKRMPLTAAMVYNVVGKLPGSSPTGAIMLVAHYDSAPMSHGASDDGAGVATLLETLRSLTSQPRMQNDVIFLFTDGEEIGLMGARAFVKEHPLAKNVKLVLNFEARGTRGPSLMFETSPNNANLIRELSKSSAFPIANSLMYEIYRLMPNDTDFSVFKLANMEGFNFAYIDDANNYHSVNDDLNHIDARSLQHHGSYAVSLVNQFGNSSFEKSENGSAVYFNLLGGYLVTYPASWVLVIFIFTVTLFISVFALGVRKKRITLSAIGIGLIAIPACIFVAIVASKAIIWALGRASVDALLMVGTLMGISLTLMSALTAWAEKKKKTSALLIAVFAFWIAAQALMIVYAPTASYFFAWPLIAALLGALYLFSLDEPGRRPLKHCFILSLFAAPALLIVLPMIYLTIIGLGISAAPILITILILLFGLLIPNLIPLMSAQPRLSLGVLFSVSMIFVFTAILSRNVLLERNQIFYNLDADIGKATWSSAGRRTVISKTCPNNIETKMAHDNFPSINLPFNSCEAPALQLIAPQAEVTSILQKQDKRVLEIRIRSLRKAPMLMMQVNSASRILSAAINGVIVSNPKSASAIQKEDRWEMMFYAPPENGILLTLEVRLNEPVGIKVIDVTYELPSIPGLSSISELPDLTPGFLGLPDSTLISKSFVL
jgi:hypothetical protein